MVICYSSFKKLIHNQTALNLPTHEYGICFHLFRPSLISFSDVLQFSIYPSFTSSVKFIPKDFVLIDAIINRL